MLDVVGEDLVVIANTGDDIEIYDALVCPDPDLVAFWLADCIDERGWGIEGDTFDAMKRLRARGEDVWFNLGDRDLEIGLRRAESIRRGRRLTETFADLCDELGISARVLPMSDAPVRTWVQAGDQWSPFQEYMILRAAPAPIQDVEFRGADAAEPPPEALAALREARVIVIGPSNPVISIGPILAVLGDEVRAAKAPVVAISPIVGGEIVKGPTAQFMAWAGLPTDIAGIERYYAGLLDGLVGDERENCSLPVHVTETLMTGPDARKRLSEEVLAFAETLR
jgi:LPPG:FO 2-phospho-L-lactate transferase